MTRDEAVLLIDTHKNNEQMVNPVDLLEWTWLRVIVDNVSDDAWDEALERAKEILGR